MATWAIGDIQGCLDPLQRLLTRVRFDPGVDRLWLVGDLVNRGPDNVGVLRLLMGLGDRVQAVLGNHDLHALAVAEGCRPAGRGDTLQDLLAAPDRDDLLAWLGDLPLLHREGPWLMVHAGLAPEWTEDRAQSLAEELQEALRGPARRPLLSSLSQAPDRWREGLCGLERWRFLTAAFTRIRACDARGRLLRDYTGPASGLPSGFAPWFAHPHSRDPALTVLFGHWAALGLSQGAGWAALDTGCVWGRQLTAMRLEDGLTVSVEALSSGRP